MPVIEPVAAHIGRRARRPASLALRVTAWVGLATTLTFLVAAWVLEASIEEHFAGQDLGSFVRWRRPCGWPSTMRPLASAARTCNSASPSVGADADLSHISIGNWAMANALCEPSSLDFGAPQPAYRKPGTQLKSAPASTVRRLTQFTITFFITIYRYSINMPNFDIDSSGHEPDREPIRPWCGHSTAGTGRS